MFQRVLKQNSLFVGAIVGSAFLLESTGNGMLDSVFDSFNKSKLWKDLEASLNK